MKLSIKSFALASGLASAIFYVVCCLLFALTPGFTIYLFNNIIHADLSVFTKVFTWGNFFVGLIVLFVMSYLLGALFAWLYNKFLKE